MGSVFCTLAFALSPKLLQFVMKGARGAQVKSIFLRDWIIQRRIITMGMQPKIESILYKVNKATAVQTVFTHFGRDRCKKGRKIKTEKVVT